MAFTCIAFGPSADDTSMFWNYSSRNFTYQSHAERFALEQLNIGGTTGYVVIKHDNNSWRVIDEVGSQNTSIACTGDTFSVQPAPKLQLV